MKPDRNFQKALDALNGRNLPEAELLFLKVLKTEPSHVPSLNLLTVVLMTMQRFADAEKYIARAVHLNQSSDVSFYNYGVILHRLGRPEEAITQFGKAIEIKPGAETWNARRAVLNALARYGEAVADFDQALKLNPTSIEGLTNKGHALLALGREGEAGAAYDAALAIRPDFEAALLGRGDALWSSRQYDEAVAAYRNAFTLKGAEERAQIRLGRHGAGSSSAHSAPHAPDERDCELVSSRGLMKSCDVFPAYPVSSTYNLYDADWSALRPGAVVYVPGSAIPNFQRYVLDEIKVPIILVSGDCDESIAGDIFITEAMQHSFIEHPMIAHWFSQNLVTRHPKCTQIPIGMDFHSLTNAKSHRWGEGMPPLAQEATIKQVAAEAPAWASRSPLAYCNFQFRLDSRFDDDRRTAMSRMDGAALFMAPQFVPREQTWVDQSRYAFVISPHGNGLDCHRTWEALALGCVPIMRHSPLDPLFEGLPVVLVDDWADVTPALIASVQNNPPPLAQPERLTLAFWTKLIRDRQRSHS